MNQSSYKGTRPSQRFEMASFFFQQACKPGSVSGASHMGPFPEIYHLSERPTPRHRASNPLPVYMVFQPKRRAAPGVTTGSGELLPHLLTLTPVPGAVIFFPAAMPSRTSSSQKFGALCCPDFPSPVIRGTIDRPAGLLQS